MTQMRDCIFPVMIMGLLLTPASDVTAQRRGEGEYHVAPDKVREPVEGPAAPTPEDQEMLDDMLRQARLLFELDKIDSAVLIYNDILKLAPNHLPALQDLLKIFFKTNNWAMVIATLEQIIALKPDDTLLRELLVIVYDYYQMPENIVKLRIELAAIEPENEEYAFDLADTLYTYGFIERTIGIIEALHQRSPRNPAYIRRMAEIHEEHNRYAESLEYYVKLAELQPDDASLQLKVAGMYLGNNRPFAALELYREALARDPENALIKNQISYVYAEIAKYYYYLDRLARSKEYFTLAAQGEQPYPWARAYLKDIRRAMSWKPLYDFRLDRYTFQGQTLRLSHHAALELPYLGPVHRWRLHARRRRIDDQLYDVDVEEYSTSAEVDVRDGLRTQMEIGYFEAPDLPQHPGELLYRNRWMLAVDEKTDLTLGVERKHVFDSSEAVVKNIFTTAYELLASRYFLGEQLWTAFEYRYNTFTGGNASHFAKLDIGYSLFKELFFSQDFEQKPPLDQVVRKEFGVGANLEYITFDETNDLYFTFDDQLFFLARADYSHSPIRTLNLALHGAAGVSLPKGDAITEGTAALTYHLPFRVRAELAYDLANIMSTRGGALRSTLEHTLRFAFVGYF